jgi:hypothetical protein
MAEIVFTHPHTLLSQVGKVLNQIGAVDFFRSPKEEVKKAREGFAAYFFTLALKQYTGRDWWLAQFDQKVKSYPDFEFISFAEKSTDLRLESVELVGIYPHFKKFDEMLEVIENKRTKYGISKQTFSLLIFVNHEKSEEWITSLRDSLKTESPFISVWTIHLRFKKGGQEVGKAVAQRICPHPGLRIEADMDNPEIHKQQPIPEYMEEIQVDGKTFVRFKKAPLEDFMKLLKEKKN